jgi:hypothetical protein
MRRLVLALALVLALVPVLMVLPADLQAAPPMLTVMTRNVYVGFDVDITVAALASGNPTALLVAVRQAFADVRATDLPERAEALAREIGRRRPDVIGLQAMSLLRSQDPPDGSPVPDATTVVASTHLAQEAAEPAVTLLLRDPEERRRGGTKP